MRLFLSVVLALASALAFAAATVGQQRAAARSSDAEARTGRFVGQLLRNPRWIAATLGNAVGYSLQAAALGVGSVVVVQPILVTSLLFALPLSARLARQRLPSTAVVSALLLSVSLSVLVILGEVNKGLGRGSYQGWLIVAVVVVPLVTGCLIFAHARSGAVRASLLAIAVGLLGGVLAVLTKSVVDAGSSGVVHLLATGETYALVVVGLGGTYLQQLSFQAGALQASLPIMTVLEPVIAVVLGLTLLHEQLRTDSLRMTALVAAALTMGVATVALARVQATAGTGTPMTRLHRGSVAGPVDGREADARWLIAMRRTVNVEVRSARSRPHN
jgi:drug/metabolite transporter (DMT)-like permease